MSKATVKHVAVGKNDGTQIYCKSKSGIVYALRNKVPAKNVHVVCERIREAGVINTKQWVKIREGAKPKPAPAAKPHTPRPEMTYSMKDEYGNPVTLIVDNRLPLLRGVWA